MNISRRMFIAGLGSAPILPVLAQRSGLAARCLLRLLGLQAKTLSATRRTNDYVVASLPCRPLGPKPTSPGHEGGSASRGRIQ